MSQSAARRQIADLFRVVGLNSKFLQDRRQQLTSCKSFSCQSLIKEFDSEGRGYVRSSDVLKFLSSRYVVHSEEEFIYTLELMDVDAQARISYEQLLAFFGSEKGYVQSYGNSGLSEECEKRVISVLEQAISNYRRLEAQRSSLATLGKPHELFQAISSTSDLSAELLLELVKQYCAVDEQLAAEIFKCLGAKRRLTYKLFCELVVSPEKGFRKEAISYASKKTQLQDLGHGQLSESDKQSSLKSSVVAKAVKGRCGGIAAQRKPEQLELTATTTQYGSRMRKPQGSYFFPQQAWASNVKQEGRNNSSQYCGKRTYHSPSMARLDDFQQRIKALQSDKQLVHSVTPAQGTGNKSRSSCSQTERSLQRSRCNQQSTANYQKPDYNKSLFDNLRAVLKLGDSKGDSPQDSRCFGSRRKSDEDGSESILRLKEQEIQAELNLRSKIQTEIERSKKEIDKLKDLLNLAVSPSVKGGQYDKLQKQSAYRNIASPITHEKRLTLERQAGKIRCNNALGTSGHATTSKGSSYLNRGSQRQSGRLHLDEQLTKLKLLHRS